MNNFWLLYQRLPKVSLDRSFWGHWSYRNWKWPLHNFTHRYGCIHNRRSRNHIMLYFGRWNNHSNLRWAIRDYLILPKIILLKLNILTSVCILYIMRSFDSLHRKRSWFFIIIYLNVNVLNLVNRSDRANNLILFLRCNWPNNFI